MYKTIKLNKKEIKIIKMALIQEIINLKIQVKDIEEYSTDEIKINNEINERQKLLNYLTFIQR